MNPWKQTLLNFLRDIMRFALWLCIALSGFLNDFAWLAIPPPRAL